MRRYVLIGYPLGHSFSAEYFNRKFSREGMRDVAYSLTEMPSASEFPDLIRNNREIAGVNVTIPLKSEIIPFLDDLDPVAAKIGAVNCIRIDRDSGLPRTRGFNTDYSAFRDTLEPLLKPHHKKAVILGTGGSAKAVAYAMRELGIDYTFVSRSPEEGQLEYDAVTKTVFQSHPVVVNTTPLGMYPQTDTLPSLPYALLSTKNLMYDLVYNPDITRFLQEGKKQGAGIKNGLEMLYLQAEHAWKIWNPLFE